MKKIIAAVFALFFATATLAQAATDAKPAEGAKPAAHKVVKHKKMAKKTAKKPAKKMEKKEATTK